MSVLNNKKLQFPNFKQNLLKWLSLFLSFQSKHLVTSFSGATARAATKAAAEVAAAMLDRTPLPAAGSSMTSRPSVAISFPVKITECRRRVSFADGKSLDIVGDDVAEGFESSCVNGIMMKFDRINWFSGWRWSFSDKRSLSSWVLQKHFTVIFLLYDFVSF